MSIRTLIATALAIQCLVFAAPVAAGEQEDADSAAKQVLDLLTSAQFPKLWDSQASKHLKKTVKRDDFLRDMQIGRANIGKLQDSQLVKSSVADADDGAGFKGRVYTAMYLNTYESGKFYERIVLVREQDGKFRLAGIQGMQVPKEGMQAPAEKQ